MKAFLEEIMADHVHQEMTRNLILVYLRLFLLIVIKDVFLFLVFFSEQIEEPNGSNSSYERYRNTKTRKKESRAYCESSPLKVQAVIIRFRIPLNNFLKK